MSKLATASMAGCSDNTSPVSGTWTHCLRARRSYRHIGIACSCLFGVMGIASTATAFVNPDNSFPHPIAAAVLLAAIWTGFTLLGLWLILFYHRYRLWLSETEFLQSGVLTTKSARLKDIRDLKWRTRPAGGSLKLTATCGTVVIDFATIEKEHRDMVIAFFHQNVSRHMQSGWDEFHERFMCDNPTKRARARRIGRLLVALLFGHAVAFFTIWLWNQQGRFLVLSIVNLGVGVWYLWSRRGSRESARHEHHGTQ